MSGVGTSGQSPIWLFDLDNTLHDASAAVFQRLNQSMTDYIVQHLGMEAEPADALRRHYWQRYGATLLGLERHHGVQAAHFLAQTHELPGLEDDVRIPSVDRAALRRLPGRKYLLTNAPLAYAQRVLSALRLLDCFDGIVAIEHMRVFGQLRPKPDPRMLKVVLARHGLPAHRCVLVEDTLANLKTARATHLRTVWMQHYLRPRPGRPAEVEGLHRRPPWVCARIRRLRALQHAFPALHDPLPDQEP